MRSHTITDYYGADDKDSDV